MKASDAKTLLGISERTLADQEFDPTELVTHEEFKRHTSPGKRSYRERSVDRLIQAKVGFGSSSNIIYELARRLITITCPHCSNPMEQRGGGGSSSETSIEFRCKTPECETQVHLTVPNDSGINIRPKK